MALTPEEIKVLFHPSSTELKSMDKFRDKKVVPDCLPVMERLFETFGLVFKKQSCDRIAAYGADKFIDEATSVLIENKEVVSYIRDVQRIEKRLEVLREEHRKIGAEINELEYGEIGDEEYEDPLLATEEAENTLLKDMGLTPTEDCAGKSFLQFFLLSFMESKTPKPIKKYSELNLGRERTKYIDDLEKRIRKLEAKS